MKHVLETAIASAILFPWNCSLAEDIVAPEFRGDWVPATATCSSDLRLRVTGSSLTLINGKDSATYGDLGIAVSYFGPDYSGISVVVMPDMSKDEHPFSVFFNADEQKGVTTVSIDQGDEVKGPAAAYYNPVIRAARQLAKRFPLEPGPLKKCPGAKP